MPRVFAKRVPIKRRFAPSEIRVVEPVLADRWLRYLETQILLSATRPSLICGTLTTVPDKGP
jgi:hypothetical protein